MLLKITFAIAMFSDELMIYMLASLCMKIFWSSILRFLFIMRQISSGSAPYMSGRIGISRDTPSSLFSSPVSLSLSFLFNVSKSSRAVSKACS